MPLLESLRKCRQTQKDLIEFNFLKETCDLNLRSCVVNVLHKFLEKKKKKTAVLEIGKRKLNTHKFTRKIPSLCALKIFTYINVRRELCNIGISPLSNIFLSQQQLYLFVKQNVFWEM